MDEPIIFEPLFMERVWGDRRLVVEARRMNNLSDQVEITPMLRLIHSRYFVENGVNNAKQARFNFMYIF